MRRWLTLTIRYTAILAASVFVVGLVWSREFVSASQAALIGSSVGPAMATLQYRLEKLIQAASRSAVGLWLLSSACGTPLLAWSLCLLFAGSPTVSTRWIWCLSLALSSGMSLVTLLPLSWLEGKWGQAT